MLEIINENAEFINNHKPGEIIFIPAKISAISVSETTGIVYLRLPSYNEDISEMEYYTKIEYSIEEFNKIMEVFKNGGCNEV